MAADGRLVVKKSDDYNYGESFEELAKQEGRRSDVGVRRERRKKQVVGGCEAWR
jgi:hypothetical protein